MTTLNKEDIDLTFFHLKERGNLKIIYELRKQRIYCVIKRMLLKEFTHYGGAVARRSPLTVMAWV